MISPIKPMGIWGVTFYTTQTHIHLVWVFPPKPEPVAKNSKKYNNIEIPSRSLNYIKIKVYN
jgi:hypothetical protein